MTDLAVRTCSKGHDLSVRGTWKGKCRECRNGYTRTYYYRTAQRRADEAPPFRFLYVDRIRPLMWIAVEEYGSQRGLAERFAAKYGGERDMAKKSLERVLYGGPLARVREDRIDEWLLLIGHDINAWYPEELEVSA